MDRFIPLTHTVTKRTLFTPRQHGGAKPQPLIFVTLCLLVLFAMALAFLYYEPEPLAEDFYKARKSVNDYHQYEESDSAKKKAERNVFLQD
jgi:hypothetical protein